VQALGSAGVSPVVEGVSPSALQEHDISPHASKLTDPLANTYLAKSIRFVQRDTSPVLGEDSGLESPDPVQFRLLDQRSQQRSPHASAARCFSYVDGNFCNPCINVPR